MLSVEDVLEILRVDLIGVVPDDQSIIVATNEGEPIVGNNSQAGKAFENICRRVTGEEVPYLDLQADGFFKKLASLFRKGY